MRARAITAMTAACEGARSNRPAMIQPAAKTGITARPPPRGTAIWWEERDPGRSSTRRRSQGSTAAVSAALPARTATISRIDRELDRPPRRLAQRRRD